MIVSVFRTNQYKSPHKQSKEKHTLITRDLEKITSGSALCINDGICKLIKSKRNLFKSKDCLLSFLIRNKRFSVPLL